MEYSKEFQKKLATGQTMVRKIWKNESSKIGSYSVQYMQQIKSDEVDPSRAVLAASLGYEPNQRITAILTISPKVLEAKEIPLENASYCFEEDSFLLSAKQLLGMDVEIDVLENTVQNPMQPSQEPKINPTTGEVLVHDGKPIFRHTSLVPKGEGRRKFLQHDGSTERTVAPSVEKTLERDLDMQK